MNPPRPDNATNDLSQSAAVAKYQAAVQTAVVAGMFSAVVAAVLLYDFAGRGPDVPLETAEYQAIKSELAQQPDSEEIKARLRNLDVELRKSYFHQRRFTRIGAWLLLGGVVVLLIAAKSARTLRPELPMPEPPAVPRDPEIKTMSAARWSVAVLGLALVAGAALLIRNLPTQLPTTEELAAKKQPSITPTPVGPRPTPVTPAISTNDQLEANWPRFRGPGGQGISHHKDVPTKWDAASGEGIVWNTPVPLVGNNSPVVWGDRVFLSGATEETREVYCFDARSGEILWQQEVPPDPNAPDEPLEVMDDTGFAAPTMATDGRRVYAIFATGDVAAFDFDGKPAWQKSLGRPKNAYGYASSLTTYQNLLLIQYDQGSPKEKLSKMIALDGATGETAWEMTRDVANSWPSPIVIRLEDGSHQLITASDPWVIAYDPADGRELWRSKSLQGDVGPSPAFAGGTVYVTCETAYLTAIRVDASTKGDVTETHKLWEGEDGLPDTASPLATEEFVFLAASYGILTCYDAKSGELLWEEDFDDSTFTSSPSLAGDLLYLFTEEGKAWIVKPTREGCQRIGEAELGEECVTSPAFQDGRIFIRGAEHLFAIGSSPETPDSPLPTPTSGND
jgi:outer membrane protein assembly factor BamB